MRYEIVFRGKLVMGFGEAEVRANLARLFKKDDAHITRLFDGERRVIKSDLDRPTADKYRSVLKKAGAIVAVVSAKDSEPADANAAASPDAGRSERPAAFNRAVFTPAPGPEEAVKDQGSGQRAVFTPAPGPKDGPGSPPAAPKATTPLDEITPEPGGLTLAALGALLAAPDPAPAPPPTDGTGLSLDEEGAIFDDSPPPAPHQISTDHLDAEEIRGALDPAPRPEEPQIDISALAVDDDEGPVDQTPKPPTAEFDLEGLAASAVEEPLDTHRPPSPPSIDTSQLHLE